MKPPLVLALLFWSFGFVTGRAVRSAPPPLIIQRSANSPLWKTDGDGRPNGPAGINANSTAPLLEDVVYVCGARTKKGTPCSRRVHQPTRCWQHKGKTAMLPEEKLRVKQ